MRKPHKNRPSTNPWALLVYISYLGGAATPRGATNSEDELMMRILPPLEELREDLKYDPETGQLTWRWAVGRRVRPGSIAGHLNKAGYIEIRYKNVTYQGHRIAWALYKGIDPRELHIDHINNIRHDNRIKNLRVCTQLENSWNTPKRFGTVSKYRGVSWYKRKNKWIAQIRHEGKAIHLGYFTSELEAHAAYMLATYRLRGEYARDT
jgi:hypothetical protein